MPADFLKELATKPEVEADSELPDLSHPYKAHGRAANKALYTLHCDLGKDGFRSFQYLHLDSNSEYRIEPKGQVLVVRFGGIKPVQVTIRGRNLRPVYDYIHQHRLPWIMRADRDFPDPAGKQVIITAIDFEEVSEKRGGE